MRMGWVSIVTIFHNRSEYVADSVASLLTQTYPKCLIYVVDDYSSDDTFARMHTLFSKMENVRLIRNERNKGFTLTLIDVLNTVDTEFVAIHGSGDISLPNRIISQVSVLQKYENVDVVSAAKNKKKELVSFFGTEDLIKRNRVIHGSAMFRLSAYRQVGGYRPFFVTRQDKDLWLRMSLNGKICTVHGDIYRSKEIASSVSKNDPGKVVPMLLSDFSVHLIKQRLSSGTDDLDRYGSHGALIYNPANSRRAFFRNVYVRLRARQLDAAIRYTKTLISVENSILYMLLWRLFLLPVLFSIRSVASKKKRLHD